MPIAGGEFARPIQRQAHHLELSRMARCFRKSSRAGYALVARRIFRRQAERVPAHGMQHIVPLGAAEAGDDIAHGVVAHMPHMDAPRG
jgi:hypothetical protein